MEKLRLFLKKFPRPLIIAVVAWAVLMTAIAAWKYFTFQYRDLDLAYFTQAIWNTAHLRPFSLTIHPGLTLGDHAEWLILPLGAIFAFLPHPLTLLALQALALALGALPLYRFARRRLPARWAMGAAMGYLALGALWNTALFEFHLLPFAVPLLLFAADSYDRRAHRSFLIYLLAALAVREDIALIALGFSTLAWLDRRENKWKWNPAALAASVLLLDWLVIKKFAVTGGYKFAIYYSWLGQSPAEAAAKILSDPFYFFGHFFSLPAIELVIGLLLPVLFLPLVRPRWLALSALPALGLLLTSSGGGLLAVQMHYGSILMPGIALASVDAANTLLFWKTKIFPWAPLAGRDRGMLAVILIIALAFSFWTIGPLQGLVRGTFRPVADAALARELLGQIPKNSSVAASEIFLPALAKRQNLFALKYVYLGKTQYGVADYSLSEPPDYLALDAREALIGAVNYPTLSWTKPLYSDGPSRLRQLLAAGRYGLVWQGGPYSLWQKGTGTGSIAGITGGGQAVSSPVQVGNAKVHGLKKIPDCRESELCLSLTVSLDKNPGEDLVVLLELKGSQGKILGSEARVLGDQLLPTHEWKVGELRTMNIRIPGLNRAEKAELSFFRPRGTLVMGLLRSSQLALQKPKEGGVEIDIK